MATAQQLTGVARALVDRGHSVTVITGRRGYDNEELRFPARERWQGIEIIRLPSIGLGKTSRWRRALNFASFSAACAFRLALTPRQDTVVALTSPPLISWLAALFTRMKGGRMVFWVMDLNPDEAIAAGWLKPDSMTARMLASLLQSSLVHAEKIVVMDRFMKERIVGKGVPEPKVVVIPPSQNGLVSFEAEGRDAFRRRHNLSDKFIVMYAGNHSPCHPLNTLLEAANNLRDSGEIAFCFVGGGSELGKVKEFARSNRLENIRCLPYQPLAELPGMLSAADLHVIIMGEAFPGIIHPCKIYNIMATGSPFLYIGPAESHVGDIISRLPDRHQVDSARHGQVDTVARAISDRAARFHRDGASTRRTDLSTNIGVLNSLTQFIAQIESSETELEVAEAAKFQSA